MVANLEFTENDTEEEREMKLRIVEVYNRRLNERYKRREFAIQRNLFDFKQETPFDRFRSQREKEIENMLRPFARFNSPESHKKLVEQTIHVRNMKLLLLQLQDYKLKGFKSLSEIEESIKQKEK